MTKAWISRLLDEPTVIWGPPVRDGAGGYSSWPAPFLANGRWEYNIDRSGPTISYSQNGTTIVARTSVWLDTEVIPGYYLLKGDLSSFPVDATPETVTGAHQVVSIKNVRAIDTTDYLYKAYLDES